MSVNANGLQGKNRFKRFLASALTWARKGDLHVICAQEHQFPPNTVDDRKRLCSTKGFKLIVSPATCTTGADGRTHYSGGTFILIHEAQVTHCETLISEQGLTRVKVEHHGMEHIVASIYAPSKPIQRVDFYTSLKAKSTGSSKLCSDTIAGGDFNFVPDVTLDVQSSNPLAYKNIGGKIGSEAMASYSLHDYRREQLGQEKEPTHTQRVQNGVTATRIDRLYIPTSKKYEDTLWNIEVREDFVWDTEPSDHKPIVLQIEAIKGEHGHSRSTINEELVFDPKIQNEIKKIVINEYSTNGSESAKWQRAMASLRDYLLQETRSRQRKDSNEIKQLRDKIEVVRRKEARTGPTIAISELLKKYKTRLFELENPAIQGLASKAAAIRMAERSDACTKAYFRSFKAQAKQQWINEIKTAAWQDGQEPSWTGKENDPGKIPEALADYYKMLFSEKEINQQDAEDLRKVMEGQQILKESANELELPIDILEIRDIMDRLPIGKQAGPNRIPNGVYRVLSRFFAPYLAKVFKEARKVKRLPSSMLEGDITLLFKKKARDDVRNYRPLTMLNTDYKIYTKILANRLKKVVHQFVAECQKGFVPKTFIAECSMLLHMIEAWINEEPKERKGIYIFLDMEKAFDRVSFDFLLTSMAALGFGPRPSRGSQHSRRCDTSPAAT